VEIKNPITSTFSVIRSQLLPILLSFESKNTHIEYPHKIFEIGEVVKNIQKNLLTKTHAAALLTGSNETFETILSVLDGFMRLQNLDYLLEDTDDEMFISGRRAIIKINDIPIGKIGEINPSILNNFGIEVPSAGLEIDLTKIPNLRIKEYDTNKL
jgi:phenylalanyl-tRNA synthetase beta chain